MKKLSTTTGWLVGHAMVALSATLVAGCGGGGGGGGGSASTAAGVTTGTGGDLVALEISPPGDLLVEEGLGAGFQVIVDGYHRDASVLDLTRTVQLKVADESVCRVGGDGLITPVAPGTTELSVTATDATGQTLLVTKSITIAPASGAQPVFTGGSLKIYPEFRTLGQVDANAGRDQLQQVVVVGTDAQGRMWDLTRTNGIAVQDMNRAPSQAGQLSPSGLFRGIVDGQEVLLVTRIDTAGLVAGCHLVLGSAGGAAPVPPSALYSGAPLAGSSNPIDQAVLSALRGQFIEPSKLTTDGDFLRRLYQDALGRVPTAAEAEAFLASTAAAKRDAEIDRVLALDAFADRWGMLVGEWFEIRRANATAFDAWAAAEIKAGKTLAELVQQLAAGTGPGAAIFDAQHATAADKVDILVLATTGMTAECAQCHDHPLTGPSDTLKWTQADRFPLDAFFAATPAEATALDKNSARVGQPFQPGFVFDRSKTVTSTLTTPIATRRAELAGLLVGTTEFRRGLAHRVFAEVSQPLLDPNQFLAKNLTAVAVPAMLDALATALDGQQTSLKGFLAVVFKSKVYQLSGDGKDTTSDALLARHVARRAHSEVMESLVANVTGSPLVGADLTFFRQTFGFPADRVTISERSTAVNLSQSLVLMNSPAVQAKLSAPTSAIGTLAGQVTANTITQEQAVRALFKTALSREPSADELGFALDTIKGAPTVRAGLEDVAAVLMSTIEAVAR